MRVIDSVSAGMSIWIMQYYTPNHELGPAEYFITQERAVKWMRNAGFHISNGPRVSGATTWFHAERNQRVEVYPQVTR